MDVIKKLVLPLVVAAVSSVVLADARDVMISFNTTGEERYADGAPVVDGEWYALVWSEDGVFEGLTADCKPIDPKDEVLLMAPLAKGGKCPYVVFKLDSGEAKTAGVYAVYLLDTRNAEKTAASPADKDGKPASVDGAIATKGYAAQERGLPKSSAVAGAWAESAVPAGEAFSQAKVTGFVIDGAKARITVSGMMPSVKYNVRMGGEVDKLESFALKVPAAGVGEAEFIVDAADAKFFQVVRQPFSAKKEAK